MKQITVSVPGKIHLMGEHTVVYGKPALLAAVDRRLRISVSQVKSEEIEIVLIDDTISKTVTPYEINKLTNQVRIDWERFLKTGDSSLLRKHLNSSFDLVMVALGEAYEALGAEIDSGLQIKISSDIPKGSGMGSSAAMAVAIVGAVFAYHGRGNDRETINNTALVIEKRQHGKPSGGDNSTVCYGGLVWYRKETDELKIIQQLPYSIQSPIQNGLYLVHTGTPRETTGEMVAQVAHYKETHKGEFETVLSEQERITRDLVEVIQTENISKVRALLQKGERNLEKIGVVSQKTIQFISSIEEIGGVAKVCGAGGYAANSGLVLVYCTKKGLLDKLAKRNTYKLIPFTFASEGLVIEYK